MNDYYIFVTPTVTRVHPIAERFVHVDDLRRMAGFQCPFAFPPATVDVVLRQGSFRRLGAVECATRVVLIDFDDKPLEAARLKALLNANDIRYDLYDSGNRSLHFHVACEWTMGTDVPQRVECWVQQWAPGADMTTYKITSLFRLPNTWHEKNAGRRKTLLESHNGYEIQLPPPLLRRQVQPGVSSREPEDVAAKLSFARRDQKSTGGRRVHAWRLGSLYCDLGYSLADAIEQVWEWNVDNCTPPLERWVVERKVSESFNQRALDVGAH